MSASASENIDLWRVLRGGGNNLGVVTRFDLRALPQVEQLKSVRALTMRDMAGEQADYLGSLRTACGART